MVILVSLSGDKEYMLLIVSLVIKTLTSNQSQFVEASLIGHGFGPPRPPQSNPGMGFRTRPNTSPNLNPIVARAPGQFYTEYQQNLYESSPCYLPSLSNGTRYVYFRRSPMAIVLASGDFESLALGNETIKVSRIAFDSWGLLCCCSVAS